MTTDLKYFTPSEARKTLPLVRKIVKDILDTSREMRLIAEEVDEVFPRLVVYDKEGGPETVRYLDLIPLMLNEIQKLNIELLKIK